jgi:protocatechuate 3,4-dioxygenase beta subunit
MSSMNDAELTRREFVGTIIATPAVLGGLAIGGGLVLLTPTPACGDDDDKPTPEDIEGPYFKAKSPERKSLFEKSDKGTKLVLKGRVLSTRREPVAKALLDFWHCDAKGDYDNEGFKHRGHQFTDSEGRFELETAFPGEYPGRTRHIHVKVQAPKQSILTTQLYFPDEPNNKKDNFFKQALVMKLEDTKAGKSGTFDFVLKLA